MSPMKKAATKKAATKKVKTPAKAPAPKAKMPVAKKTPAEELAIIAFANLAQTTAVLAIFIAVLIGVLWIVEGVVALAQLGDAPSKGWAIFFGLLSIVAGIVVLFSPLWAAELLFIIAGIALIVLGIVQIVRAFTFGRGVTTA